VRTTRYVYDAAGEVAAEYSTIPQTNPPDCSRCFLTADHLGSTRLMSDSAGNVKRRYDYAPFGWDINSSYGQRSAVSGYVTQDSSAPKFTGKERDYESTVTLDYFGSRYFSGAQGRFVSPDRLYFQKEMLTDPQRFDLYTYARNNPLLFVDPSGAKIELSADKNVRKQQLDALCSLAGQASGCLQGTYDEDAGQYYATSDANFAKLNDVAAELQEIIDNAMTASVSLVGGDDLIGQEGNKFTLNGGGHGAPHGADGATLTFDGKIHVYVRKASDSRNYGFIPSDDMSPNNHTGYKDQRTVLGHELGHALYRMIYGPVPTVPEPERLDGTRPQRATQAGSNSAALDFENKVRKLENKNAAIRIKH
jgi:RHS repeat-associated protein